MKNTIFGLLFLTSFNDSIAAVPGNDHEKLSLDIQNSIEWAQHVIEEANKGKELNVKHANVEVAHLKSWLEKMSLSYIQLSKQPVAENLEAHFIAVKTHQNKAENYLNEFSTGLNIPNRNYNQLKKIAKNIKVELQAAEVSHKQELQEIERQ